MLVNVGYCWLHPRAAVGQPPGDSNLIPLPLLQELMAFQMGQKHVAIVTEA